MFKILIFSTFVACGLSAAVPEGLLPQLDGRIVGGVPATIGLFPWQISLQRNGAHSCGGSIYSENIIVTAAHCVVGSSPSNMKIRAGSTYWTNGGLLIAVAELKYHERYNGITMPNDIAILKLVSPLSFSSTIKPIPLAAEAPVNGSLAITSGWGTLRSGGGSIPTQLQKVELSILDRAECSSSSYKYGPRIRESMICAVSAGKDACQGDSGGPLVSGGVLIGVVSWGQGCAFTDYPGVYANVAVLRSWVEENVKEILSK